MTGVQGILGRIAGIEARFDPPPPTGETIAAPDITDFDPFGEAYQAAVAAAPSASPAAEPFEATQNRATFGVASPFTAGGVTMGGSTTFGSAASTAAGPTYDQLLAAVSGVATTPGRRQVGGYGPMPIPDQLRGIGNGKIPTDSLFQIGQGNHRLYAPAAASWKNLVAAASADGIDLRITDSYRSYDQQVDLAKRKGLYEEGGLAATPGTSNHGWGLAVDADVNNPATAEWLAVNGPRFGWVESVPREPWHWEFRPNQV